MFTTHIHIQSIWPFCSILFVIPTAWGLYKPHMELVWNKEVWWVWVHWSGWSQECNWIVHRRECLHSQCILERCWNVLGCQLRKTVSSKTVIRREAVYDILRKHHPLASVLYVQLLPPHIEDTTAALCKRLFGGFCVQLPIPLTDWCNFDKIYCFMHYCTREKVSVKLNLS